MLRTSGFRSRGVPPTDRGKTTSYSLVFAAAGMEMPQDGKAASPTAMVRAANFWKAQKQDCYDWGVRHRHERLRNR